MTQNKKETKLDKLTPEQREAIVNRGKNLLVSASAGSGKTFVMIERIKEMIKSKEVGVQEILVVTFTKAAASEMKERLIKGLEEIEEKDEYLLEQLSLVNASSISTLHSFCAKLLKTYFYVIGLDPSFVLIDELEATALKSKALTKLIDSRFQVGDKAFFELLDIFSINRKEDNFREIILKFYHYLLTQTDAEEWFKNATARSYELNLEKNECARFINSYVSHEFLTFRKEADELLNVLSNANQPKLVEVINSIYINLLKIKPENTFSQNRVNAMGFEQVKTIPSKVDEGAIGLKEVVKAFKVKYGKLKELAEKQYLFDQSGEMEVRLKVTRDRIRAIFEYTKLFKEIYDNMKRDKVALDFADLEEFTLKLLKNAEIATEVREKYKYVFVDEYQDTNLIQEEILRKVTRENNLFMVGDVKQSIYKFRASEPEIFVQKYKFYTEGKNPFNEAINLNHNFRSHQDVLNFSNVVFNRNMTDNFGQVNYARDAKLVKGDMLYPKVSKVPAVQITTIGGFKQERAEIIGTLPVYSVKNHTKAEDAETLKKAECEGKVIVNHIQELLGQEIYKAKTKEVSRVEYKDIAILTASRGNYLELVLKELDKAKIPYTSDIELGVFEDNYVGTIRSFLELLNNPELDMHIFAVLNSKMFDFDINDLAEIRLASKESKFFHQAVRQSVESDDVSLKLKKKLARFFDALEKYSFLSKFTKVDELIMEVVKGTGYLTRVLSTKDGEKSVGLINKLVSFLNGKSYNSSLSKFLDYIKDNDIKFGMEGVTNGVTVTTIHKSKGLEYPVVILMGAGQSLLKRNRGEFLISKNFGAGVDFYNNENRTKQKTLVKNAIILESDRAEKEERLRLLYVALTRAVNHLVIVGTVKDDTKEVQAEDAETFLDWILPAVNREKEMGNDCYCETKIVFESDLKTTNKQNEELAFPIVFGTPNPEAKEKIRQVIDYKYPFSSLVSLPVKTSVSEVLKTDEKDYYIPTVFAGAGGEEAIKKGLAYHKLLSLINLKINTIEALNIEIEKLKSTYKISEDELKLIDLNEILTLLQNPQFHELVGSRLLKEQEFIALTQFGKTKESNVILQGIVDLIAITDDGIIVVDYKTNNSKNAEFYISHYKKQLEIYAEVAGRSLNKKVLKRLIYSFKMNKFISV